MLALVGLGINFDPTLNGIETAKECDEVFLEKYTSPLPIDVEKKLEKITGKKINIIDREEVESESLIKKAERKKICLFVVGDPLVATTHTSLLTECRKRKIETRVIHNSSILTAVGRTGLQLYKFGRTVTIAKWSENYKPTSPLLLIEKNLSIDLHTLVLLDVQPEPMDAKEGIKQLLEMEKIENKKIIKEIVVLSRLGFEDEKITYGNVEKLLKTDLGKPPFSLVVPAKLHDSEEEYLRFFKI
ncbi:MAG: diphthine synthase [Candidatus Anstonellales archaeon]